MDKSFVRDTISSVALDNNFNYAKKCRNIFGLWAVFRYLFAYIGALSILLNLTFCSIRIFPHQKSRGLMNWRNFFVYVCSIAEQLVFMNPLMNTHTISSVHNGFRLWTLFFCEIAGDTGLLRLVPPAFFIPGAARGAPPEPVRADTLPQRPDGCRRRRFLLRVLPGA